MLGGRAPFVGRRIELAQGEQAIRRALSGEGALLLFSGEAGLGKTHLAQTIASRAAGDGLRVVWGRAWEAGGAPSYWPWIQVFRALGVADAFGVSDMTADLELPQARFATFDRLARRLKAEAAEAALVVVLDDLHAADVASLLFLQFLARDLAHSRLLVLGTYRDIEARLSPEVGPLLAKIAREGEAIALERLSRDDVVAWCRALSDETTHDGDGDAERVYTLTEGNALFVHELLRVRGRAGPASLASVAKAAGLRAILDEHLSRASPSSREILQAGSVLGRELDPALVAALSERSPDEVEAAFREAEELGLVIPVAGGERVSFSHILLRERLYDELAPSRRSALHATAGEALLARGGDAATATHHLFRSSVSSERVAAVALAAAKAALGRLAFEDAIRLCEYALTKHDEDDALTTDLELRLGEALARVGKGDAARAVCSRAGSRAARLGLAERQAEAALVYGLELLGGSVDATMVSLLRQALAALPDEDSILRARVLARLASALVPCFTEELVTEVQDVSRRGIAMARRIGEPETLLYALHFGGAAVAFLAGARERADLARETMAVAESLGRPLVLLNVGGWYVSTLREQGRVAESEAAFAKLDALLVEHRLPNHAWRRAAFRATFAALAGDFDEAERQCRETFVLAEACGALMSWALLRTTIAHLRGDPFSIAPDAARIMSLAENVIGARAAIRGWLLAATKQVDAARSMLEEMVTLPWASPWILTGGETAAILGDLPLAEAFYPIVVAQIGKNSFFWAGYGTFVFGPMERIAGDLAVVLGRTDEARRWYGDAIAIGERMAAPGITQLAQRRLAALEAPAPASSMRSDRPAIRTAIELRRDGEMWTIRSSSGIVTHLKDSKGLAYLSQILAHPGQELHVTQLAELGDVSGDAGAVLDAKARGQYKARLEALRDELEEAKRFDDPMRAARAQAEIDLLADQLAGAVGLGGRDRKLGSHVERIRINVQRRLRDVLQRIEENDPELARYLTATIKTGVFCAFTPL